MTLALLNKWKSILLNFMAFAVFLALDPLGLATSTTRTSEQLIHRLVSLGIPDTANRHIAVVLVDDRSAAELNRIGGYPITFRQHASVLRPVNCASPAGLFIDITFRGLRSEAPHDPTGGDDPDLSQLIEVLGGAGPDFARACTVALGKWTAPALPTDVMIGRVRSSPPRPCDPLFATPPGEACPVERQIHRIAGVARPIPIVPMEHDGSYRIAVKDEDTGRLVPSPALAMVLAFCERTDPTTRAELAGCRDRAKLEALLAPDVDDARRTLVPVWSYFRSRIGLKELAAGCPQSQGLGEAGLLPRLAIAANELWNTILGFPTVGGERYFGYGRCLPQDTLTAIDARNLPSNCDADGDACARRIAALFTSRLVFYGVDITGINDKVTSPVLGAVPGASFHATAAENLLRLGAGFPSTPGSWNWLGHEWLVNVVAYGLAVLSALMCQSLLRRSYGRWVAIMPAAALFALGAASLILAYFGPAWILATAETAITSASHLAPLKLAAAIAVLLLFILSLAKVVASDAGGSEPKTFLGFFGRRWAARIVSLSPATWVLAGAAYFCYATGWPPANVVGIVLIVTLLDAD